MNDQSKERVDELIEKHFLGQLDDQEQAELTATLKADAAARERFRNAAMIDSELRYLASGESRSKSGSRESGQMAQLGWLAALAASLLIVGGVYFANWSPGRSHLDSAHLNPTTIRSLAQLDVGYHYRFEEGFAPQLDQFKRGEYRLTEGAVTLAFANGVSVSVESPARFTLINAKRMELELGRARAIVPEEGHGFVIATSKLEVEDLGTEFGVVVDEAQNGELHVFAGEVRLHEPNQPPELMEENQAIAWKGDAKPRTIAANEDAFATGTSIGYRHWLAQSENLRKDPSAIFYFDFEPKEGDPNTILNRAKNPKLPAGDVKEGIWATGRWPEKGALLLEHGDARIDLDITGEYDEVTIMGWVQVHRYDHAIQALFNSRDYETGEHHWNLLRNGELRVGIADAYAITTTKTIPSNHWTHVAARLDREKKVSTYFLNGVEVGQAIWDVDTPVRFGPCSIGAYAMTGGDKPDDVQYSRQLRGRIDEMGVFSRLFTDDEIRQAYDAGKNF
ncbi:FecR domain-containing protein [Blastopirellula sp. JC732]|uniref:FecR domain-containing protein n=1 Tax=Blastopirellula sediminis TaxID=2894196 RepID=A0A9X1MLI5_9BACT|nr:LamG-like jellyroll fold domain-containing protein [Blastopirellula sediminis]MCC9608384.1 FecR domain-containing protein [Blastopirellula sediminis]MCC9628839.1 FecR domain-containing protein [Blastopirellula sediminis]